MGKLTEWQKEIGINWGIWRGDVYPNNPDVATDGFLAAIKGGCHESRFNKLKEKRSYRLQPRGDSFGMWRPASALFEMREEVERVIDVREPMRWYYGTGSVLRYVVIIGGVAYNGERVRLGQLLSRTDELTVLPNRKLIIGDGVMIGPLNNFWKDVLEQWQKPDPYSQS